MYYYYYVYGTSAENFALTFASNVIKMRSSTRESIKLTKHRGGSEIESSVVQMQPAFSIDSA